MGESCWGEKAVGGKAFGRKRFGDSESYLDIKAVFGTQLPGRSCSDTGNSLRDREPTWQRSSESLDVIR